VRESPSAICGNCATDLTIEEQSPAVFARSVVVLPVRQHADDEEGKRYSRPSMPPVEDDAMGVKNFVFSGSIG